MEEIIFVILILIKIAIFFSFIVWLAKTKGCSSKIIVNFLLIGYLIVEFISIPNFRKCQPSEGSREKSCFSNMRIITGAVEMYDMDHSEMMDRLNLELLQKEGYLKNSVHKPELDCDYYRKEGNSKGDVVICCKRHGNIVENEEKIKKERASLFYKVCKPFKEAYETGYFGGIIYFLFIVFVRWLIRKPENNDEVLEWEEVPLPNKTNKK